MNNLAFCSDFHDVSSSTDALFLFATRQASIRITFHWHEHRDSEQCHHMLGICIYTHEPQELASSTGRHYYPPGTSM